MIETICKPRNEYNKNKRPQSSQNSPIALPIRTPLQSKKQLLLINKFEKLLGILSDCIKFRISSIMSKNQVNNLQSPTEMLANSSIFYEPSPKMVFFQAHEQIKYIESDSNKKHSIHSIQSLPSKGQDYAPNSRKQQPIIIYFLILLITFCISFQNIILVFTTSELNKGYMSIALAFSTVCVSLLSTYQLCKDKWKIFNLYILLDNIFLAEVASCFGFIGFLLLIDDGYWYQTITMLAFPLEIVFFVGNFRILMLQVHWSKWQVILFKLVLLADSAVFFQIGAFYMSNDYKYTGGSDIALDGKIKDFVLLYIFGIFALFVELYSKICDMDQTAELKFDYQFKQMEEEKKIERIRRSVLGINQQVEKASCKFVDELKKKSFLQIQEMPIV